MKKLFCYLFALSAAIFGQSGVSPMINQIPTRQFGHPTSEILANLPTQATPNLVMGQEFDLPGQIAFDTSGPTPILYVADIANNRVLAFKNPASYSGGRIADLVLGQQDFVSTMAQGPATPFSTGLNAPTGVAVASNGDVYVADAGNNRIMRFPAPFSQQAGTTPQPNLVIGQKNFGTGGSQNEGGNCSSKTLALANGNGAQLTSLAIDSKGNLWTVDPLNDRVLMYASANLTPNAPEPVASVVLGQNDFNTCTQGQNTIPNIQLNKSLVVDPSGLAFDQAGNLYVSDAFSRVLFFQGPNFVSQGQPATRILGVPPPPTSGTTVYPTSYTLGSIVNNAFIPPNGLFVQGNNLFVADTPQNRIVEYDIPSKWAAETASTPSPQILAVFGQVGFAAGSSNQGNPQASSFTFSSPYAGTFLGPQMWVADSGNNRVLGISLNSANTYSGASVLIGQLDYIYNAPNLIVGQEVFLSGALGSESAMVVDNSTGTPHLYVADPGNNRILCFADARKVSQGSTLTTADRVIGQTDLKSSVINSPSGAVGQPSATGLYNPIGVVVDNNGNLYVADAGNGRVVRFPAPFNQPAGQQATANLVLGQSSFTSFIQNPSANSMHSPWGLALFAGSDANATPLAGNLAVSDSFYNRVLLFKKQAGGDFTSGQNAYAAIGQSSFTATSPGNGPASFSSPRGIAADTSDRLYVADSVNGRIVEFIQAPETIASGPTSTNTLAGLNQPQAVAINPTTSELWVANTNSGLVLRYPEYTSCQLSTCLPTATLSSYAPLGLALDSSGNVIVGDFSNRITFYFPKAFFRNAANYNTQPLAPGMLAILGRLGLQMSIKDGAAQSVPWPTTLADLNLTVNGVAAPLFATSSAYGSISFQVPFEAPISGTADFIVTQFSTGAVLAVGSFQMTKANPGFFTAVPNGFGQVAAQNADGTPNSPANPAGRGTNITLYMTGLGQVTGAPADGQPPSGSLPAPAATTLFIGQVDASSQISYSGLGAFPGGWQINVTIPMAVAPTSAAQIVVQYDGIPSNIGGYTNPDGSPGLDVKLTGATATTIAVKQ